MYAKQRSTGGDGTIKPQLTSLIDVMTILLVFLMKSFSAEGNLVTPSADLTLPESSSQQHPEPVTTVEISRNAVVVEGETVADPGNLGPADSLMIAGLHDWLTTHRAVTGSEADTSARELMIQADRDIEFTVIKKVMYTCSRAGYADFSVLVLEEG